MDAPGDKISIGLEQTNEWGGDKDVILGYGEYKI
jgi:hypothetical protein